jgi:hypothetical protein
VKRTNIWDACVAEINGDPSTKESFETQMIALAKKLGQFLPTYYAYAYAQA